MNSKMLGFRFSDDFNAFKNARIWISIPFKINARIYISIPFKINARIYIFTRAQISSEMKNIIEYNLLIQYK